MGKLITGVNDLKTLYPELAKEWHPTLNGDKTPDQVAARSNTKYMWLCKNGHAYDATPDKRTLGEGCPYCNNRRLLVGYNDLETVYPNIAADWDYEKNGDTPKDHTYRENHIAFWKCKTCGHEWPAKIRDRVDSKYQLCPKCTLKKRGESKHKQVLAQKGGITDPIMLAEWDYKKNEKGPEEYTSGSNESVFWICSKCGYSYPAQISNKSAGRGCPCCSNKTVVPGINDLATTHPQLAAEWHPTKNGELKPTDVTYGKGEKVWWLCPEGHEYQATILHRASGGTNCPKCVSGRQTSFAEQAVFFYVKKVFPDAINRYSEIFNKGMELDIYIPSIKLGIEYDGEAWHKKDKLHSEIKKYKICQQHGIRLLRLMEKPLAGDRLLTADEALSIEDGPMYEKKHLAKVIRFLLDQIDPESNPWTRRKPIFHSRVDINLDRDELEIRSYMTNIKGKSLADKFPELAKEWHPTRNGQLTPQKVKPGSDISVWWICPDCGNEYRAAIRPRAIEGTGCPICGIEKSAKHRRKAVIMIDPITYEVIKEFESIRVASKELKINESNISTVCKGQRRKAGGYIWRYVNELPSSFSLKDNGQLIIQDFL